MHNAGCSTTRFDTYLGLPACVWWSRRTVFAGLKTHVWQRLHGWKESLFVAGKEVIIKAIAQSIPTYVSSSNYHWVCVMNWQQLLTLIGEDSKEMNTLFIGLIIQSYVGLRTKEVWVLERWHLLIWLCCLNNIDDSFKIHNLCLLRCSQPSIILTVHSEAQLGNCPSHSWRSVLAAKPLPQQGLRWRMAMESVRL